FGPVRRSASANCPRAQPLNVRSSCIPRRSPALKSSAVATYAVLNFTTCVAARVKPLVSRKSWCANRPRRLPLNKCKLSVRINKGTRRVPLFYEFYAAEYFYHQAYDCDGFRPPEAACRPKQCFTAPGAFLSDT